jgi:hypothetical protein
MGNKPLELPLNGRSQAPNPSRCVVVEFGGTGSHKGEPWPEDYMAAHRRSELRLSFHRRDLEGSMIHAQITTKKHTIRDIQSVLARQ